jgi:hypothetical protein
MVSSLRLLGRRALRAGLIIKTPANWSRNTPCSSMTVRASAASSGDGTTAALPIGG